MGRAMGTPRVLETRRKGQRRARGRARIAGDAEAPVERQPCGCRAGIEADAGARTEIEPRGTLLPPAPCACAQAKLGRTGGGQAPVGDGLDIEERSLPAPGSERS